VARKTQEVEVEVEVEVERSKKPTVHLSKVKSITQILGLGGSIRVLKVWKDTLVVHLLKTVMIRHRMVP
jgi:hypothetical protein